MTAPDQNDIDEARAAAKGADIFKIEVDIDDETFYAIVTAPKKPDYLRFLTEVKTEDPGKMVRAQESLLQSCRLWPEADELKKHLDAKVLLAPSMASELMKHAGSEAKSRSGKL